MVTEDRKSAPEHDRPSQPATSLSTAAEERPEKVQSVGGRKKNKFMACKKKMKNDNEVESMLNVTFRDESRAVKGQENVGRKSCCRKYVGMLGKCFLS